MRDLTDLYANAEKFWPGAITELERNSSIIPKLIDSQDTFISLLTLANSEPISWIEALKLNTGLAANLFLKHLMVLSDIGGEKLMRFRRELPDLLENNKLEFIWNGNNYEYTMESLTKNSPWSNKALCVDGLGLIENVPLNQEIQDVAMLILFGGSAICDLLPEEIEVKCIVGTMLGKKPELDLFVKQRYIWVSKITGGAQANALGQIAQSFIIANLNEKLPKGWDLTGKNIPGVTQNNRTLMAFDCVANSPNGKFCAIEISFQVTTNSTIERKAGQSKNRAGVLHRRGHKIAYIIDGAGNFQRESALKTISRYSDCIVTFKPEELNSLVEFLLSIDNE